MVVVPAAWTLVVAPKTVDAVVAPLGNQLCQWWAMPRQGCLGAWETVVVAVVCAWLHASETGDCSMPYPTYMFFVSRADADKPIIVHRYTDQAISTSSLSSAAALTFSAPACDAAAAAPLPLPPRQ